MSPTPAVLLVGVDRAAFAVALVDRLRAAGLTVGLSETASFTEALGVCPPAWRSRLYWTARITLVRERAELATFDTVFDAVFGEAVLALDPAARRSTPTATGGEDDVLAPVDAATAPDAAGSGLPWATLPAVVAPAEQHPDGELLLPQRLPSDLAGCLDIGFGELDPEDMERIGDWLEHALAHWPTRRTRRRAAHRRGHHLALRRTLQRSRRTGYEPIELVHDRPRHRPRRLVMVCDVSRSMQPHALAYLHLMRAATLATDAEVFAFATSLTRLTAVLSHQSAAFAIEQAAVTVEDRFGGTRIATNLRALLASRHGSDTRGAILIIASDGWDSDPPEQLAGAMARLHRRAHRVIWLNPRSAAPDFRPLVGSMAAALPYCDVVLPAHNLRALGDVIDAVTATEPGARHAQPGRWSASPTR